MLFNYKKLVCPSHYRPPGYAIETIDLDNNRISNKNELNKYY